MVPPPSAARATCSPRRAKSADKIEGASSINLGLSGKIPKFYHAGERRADTLVRTFVRTFYNLSFRGERIVKQFAESRNPSTSMAAVNRQCPWVGHSCPTLLTSDLTKKVGCPIFRVRLRKVGTADARTRGSGVKSPTSRKTTNARNGAPSRLELDRSGPPATLIFRDREKWGTRLNLRRLRGV